MPDDQPRSGPRAPGERLVETGAPKEGKTDAPSPPFIARLEGLPPIKPKELGSRIWGEGFGLEHPPRDAAQTTPRRVDGPLRHDRGRGSHGEPNGDGDDLLDPTELGVRIAQAVGARLDEATAAGQRALASSLRRALPQFATSLQNGMQTAFRDDLQMLVLALEEERGELGERLSKLESAVDALKPLPEIVAGIAARVPAADVLNQAVADIRERIDEVRRGISRPLEELRGSVAGTLPTRGELDERLAAVGERIAESERAMVADATGLEQRVSERLAEMEAAGAGRASALEHRLSELVREVGASRDALSAAVEAVEGKVTDEASTSAEIDRRLGEVREQVSQVAEAGTDTAAWMQQQFGEMARGLEGLRDRLHRSEEVGAAAAERSIDTVRTHVDDRLSLLERKMEESLAEKIPDPGRIEGRLSDLTAAVGRADQVEDVRAAVAGIAEALDQQSTVHREMVRALKDLRTRVEGVADSGSAEAAEVRHQVAAVEARLEEVQGLQAAAVRRLEDGMTDMGKALEGRLPSRSQLEDLSLDMRRGLERVEQGMASATALEQSVAALTDRFDRVEGAVEAVGSLAELEGALLSRLPDRERMENGLARLGARITQLDEAVAAVAVPDVEALGRAVTERLAAAEEALDGLAAAVKAVEGIVAEQGNGALEERVAGAVSAELAKVDTDLASRVEGLLRPELAGALQEAFRDFRSDLRAAMTGRAQVRDLRDVVRLQREFEKALAEVRGEIESLSTAVASFGRPRTAPRLAQDVASVERRLQALEKAFPRRLSTTLENRIVPLQQRIDAVAGEVQDRVAAIDLESVTRALEALSDRVREAVDRKEETERSRGRFRRSR